MSAWPIVSLGDACEFIRGITFKPTDLVQSDTAGSVPCFRTKNIQADLRADDLIYVPHVFVKGDRQLVREGDILISTANSNNLVGKCCYVPRLDYAATLGGFIAAGRPNADRVLPRFLFHWFSSPSVQERLRGLARQTTNIANLPLSDVAKEFIPLPPLSEQERIVRIVDEADALRRLRAEADQRTAALIPALFHEMFGDPATNPKGWEVSTIGDIADVSTGRTPSRTHLEYFGGTIPWVKTTEVNGSVITDTGDKLTEEGFRSVNGKLFPCGSIIVAMYGQGKTRGQSGQLAIEAFCNQACAVILPSANYVTEYLLSYLQLAYQRLRALARGGNQENLNLDIIRSFGVPVPPLAPQEQFAARVGEIRAMQARQAEARARLDDLFQSLLHRAFSGAL